MNLWPRVSQDGLGLYQQEATSKSQWQNIFFLNILLNTNFLKSFLFILHGQHWSAEMLFSWAPPKAPSSMYLQNHCFKGKGQWGLVPYILKLLPRSVHVTPSHASLRRAGHKQMPYPLTPEPHPSSKEAGMYDFSKCLVGEMEHSWTALSWTELGPSHIHTSKPPMTVWRWSL